MTTKPQKPISVIKTITPCRKCANFVRVIPKPYRYGGNQCVECKPDGIHIVRYIYHGKSGRLPPCPCYKLKPHLSYTERMQLSPAVSKDEQ